jgi:hypothetical protein
VELTSTNRPFGLIIKLSQAVTRQKERAKWPRKRPSQCNYAVRSARAELVWPAMLEVRRWTFEVWKTRATDSKLPASVVTRLSSDRLLKVFLLTSRANLESRKVSGDQTARVTPVPIPNTEVKPRWADDTARVTVWERRSSPGLIPKAASSNRGGLFVLGNSQAC